jgi:hypothetical protein
MNEDRKDIFEGKTAEDIFREIYDFCVEERSVALGMFNKLNDFIKEPEDGFMQGDKPSPYLDSAHKATENIIKMLQVINKTKDMSAENNGSIDISSVINLLDEKDIAPDRMRRNREEEEESKDIFDEKKELKLNIKKKG